MDNKKVSDLKTQVEAIKDIFNSDNTTAEKVNPMSIEDVTNQGITFDEDNTNNNNISDSNIIDNIKVVNDTNDITEEVVKVDKSEPTETKIAISPKTDKTSNIKRKITDINVGKLVTVIYGDFDNPTVLNGKIVSIIEEGITIIDNNNQYSTPIIIRNSSIIDIFKVKRFKKEKTPFTIFKLNKRIKEFFTGTDEELQHAYEQKITVKKLREELKNKDKD